EPGAVEQDRLLRQPFETTARGEREARRDRSTSCEAAIDSFAGRGGDGERRSFREIERGTPAVAAGEAAGGIDERRPERIPWNVRKAQPRRALLIEPAQHRARRAGRASNGGFERRVDARQGRLRRGAGSGEQLGHMAIRRLISSSDSASLSPPS